MKKIHSKLIATLLTSAIANSQAMDTTPSPFEGFPKVVRDLLWVQLSVNDLNNLSLANKATNKLVNRHYETRLRLIENRMSNPQNTEDQINKKIIDLFSPSKPLVDKLKLTLEEWMSKNSEECKIFLAFLELSEDFQLTELQEAVTKTIQIYGMNHTTYGIEQLLEEFGKNTQINSQAWLNFYKSEVLSHSKKNMMHAADRLDYFSQDCLKVETAFETRMGIFKKTLHTWSEANYEEYKSFLTHLLITSGNQHEETNKVLHSCKEFGMSSYVHDHMTLEKLINAYIQHNNIIHCINDIDVILEDFIKDKRNYKNKSIFNPLDYYRLSQRDLSIFHEFSSKDLHLLGALKHSKFSSMQTIDVLKFLKPFINNKNYFTEAVKMVKNLVIRGNSFFLNKRLSSSIEKELLYACCAFGDLEILRDLLQQTPWKYLIIDLVSENCIEICSFYGHTDLIKALLKHGARMRVQKVNDIFVSQKRKLGEMRKYYEDNIDISSEIFKLGIGDQKTIHNLIEEANLFDEAGDSIHNCFMSKNIDELQGLLKKIEAAYLDEQKVYISLSKLMPIFFKYEFQKDFKNTPCLKEFKDSIAKMVKKLIEQENFDDKVKELIIGSLWMSRFDVNISQQILIKIPGLLKGKKFSTLSPSIIETIENRMTCYWADYSNDPKKVNLFQENNTKFVSLICPTNFERSTTWLHNLILRGKNIPVNTHLCSLLIENIKQSHKAETIISYFGEIYANASKILLTLGQNSNRANTMQEIKALLEKTMSEILLENKDKIVLYAFYTALEMSVEQEHFIIFLISFLSEKQKNIARRRLNWELNKFMDPHTSSEYIEASESALKRIQQILEK